MASSDLPVLQTPDFSKLFIGNISYHTREQQIEDLFGAIGIMTECRIAREHNGRSKGFGFVSYKKTEHADVAIQKLHRYEVDGRLINVEFLSGLKAAPIPPRHDNPPFNEKSTDNRDTSNAPVRKPRNYDDDYRYGNEGREYDGRREYSYSRFDTFYQDDYAGLRDQHPSSGSYEDSRERDRQRNREYRELRESAQSRDHERTEEHGWFVPSYKKSGGRGGGGRGGGGGGGGNGFRDNRERGRERDRDFY